MGEVVDDLEHLVQTSLGLPESVPNEATLVMLTAGPIGSDGGAFQIAVGNWARVSLTVLAEIVSVLLKATA